MLPPLTYATVWDYLLDLGVRFSLIGRSELTLSGEASSGAQYPLLLIEADPAGAEILRNGVEATGLDNFTIAMQVLTLHASPTAADLQAMLIETNGWADMLIEQVRQERPQQVAGPVNKLALPGQAGSALACGWRLELPLKVLKDINRTTNRALFAPETL